MKGKVVDVEPGKGIGDAAVTLKAKDPAKAGFGGEIKTMTNSDGEFEAKGLEAIESTVQVENTYDARAKVLRDASGQVTGVHMPPVSVPTPIGRVVGALTGASGSGGGSVEPTVTGGDPQVAEIKRLRSRW